MDDNYHEKIINLLGFLAVKLSDYDDKLSQSHLLSRLGLAHPEIAQILEIKSDQVRKYIHAAKNKKSSRRKR